MDEPWKTAKIFMEFLIPWLPLLETLSAFKWNGYLGQTKQATHTFGGILFCDYLFIYLLLLRRLMQDWNAELLSFPQ